jgi:putative molybdopterin biosynthesis protein
MNEIELLTVEEVSAFLKLGVPTIREMIKRGDIPASKIGRQYRINKADVERLVKTTAVEFRPQQ